MLLAGSCSKQLAAASKTFDGPFSLQLTTSGGFAGVGRGNISVSGGKFGCSQTSQQNVRKGVEGTLNARQQQPIIDALAQVNPKDWTKPGLDVAAPDAFGYKLELQMGSYDAPVFTVQWYDNTKDQLPADLKRLSNALLQTMESACSLKP